MQSSIFTHWFGSTKLTLNVEKSDYTLTTINEHPLITYLDDDNDDCIVVANGVESFEPNITQQHATVNTPQDNKPIDVGKLIFDIASASAASSPAATCCVDSALHSLSSATNVAVCALQCWLDSMDSELANKDIEIVHKSWLYEAMYKYAHRNLSLQFAPNTVDDRCTNL